MVDIDEEDNQDNSIDLIGGGNGQTHTLGVIGIEHQITLIQKSNLTFRISPIKKKSELRFMIEHTVEQVNDTSNP